MVGRDPGLRRTRRAVLRARQSRTTAGTRPCGHELSGHCEAEDTACAQGCGERRDLSTAATALNKFLALQAKEIGLAGAIVTAFNRSQGAHVRKQVEWEKKQVRAAGTYAEQYATLILAEVKLSASVRRAFTSPANVSEEQAFAFQSSLIDGPLPAPLARSLSKLGLTKAELKEVEAQLIVRNHPSLYDGDVFALVVDPLHLSIRRQVAAGLKTFAKKAAKYPLTRAPKRRVL